MSQPERADRLRRRPVEVRYYWLASTKEKLHTGVSYGGLSYAKDKGIVELYLSDIIGNKVYKVTESVDKFMERWRLHYNEPEWDYGKEVGK